AWLRINADGSVTVFTGKVELGQGIVTALAQIAAEELEVPLGRVTMISGDTGRTPNEGQTAGSQSIEQSGTALRMAGAEVRALLIGLAARKLGVSADTLKVTDGVIHAPDGRKVGYGELTAEADLKREEQAINARLVLIEFAKWSGGSELPDPAKMYEQLMSLRSEDRVIGEKDAPVPVGAKVLEATYHRPYQAHAAIAPSCAVAELK